MNGWCRSPIEKNLGDPIARANFDLALSSVYHGDAGFKVGGWVKDTVLCGEMGCGGSGRERGDVTIEARWDGEDES